MAAANPTRKFNIVSADGHTMEPPHVWETYLPDRFHDRMPRLVKDPEGGDAWEVVPGQPAMPIGLVTNSGEWGKRYEDNSWFGETYESVRQGAFDGNVESNWESQCDPCVAMFFLTPSWNGFCSNPI